MARAILISIVIVCVSAVMAGAQESQTTEISAALDTWVDQLSSETAHSEDDVLVARHGGEGVTRILMTFSFSGISGDIISAALRLNLLSGSGPPEVPIAVSALQAPIDASVDWNNQPERSHTYQVVNTPASPGLIEWDVTQLVQETWGETGTLHGIAISGPLDGEYERRFASSESDGGPQLAITHVPPQPVESESARNVRIALIALIVVLAGVFLGRRVFRRRRHE